MFGKKTWVLAIADNKIIVSRVDIRNKKIDKGAIFDWTSGELAEVIANTKQEFDSNNIRLLLAEDLSEYFGFYIPEDVSEEERQEYLYGRLKEELPDRSDPELWGYQDAGLQDKKRRVIVFTPIDKLTSELEYALVKNDIQIDLVETETVSSTRHENPIIGIALNSKKHELMAEKPKPVDSEEKKNGSILNIKNKQKFMNIFKLSLTILLALITVGTAYYYFKTRNMGSSRQEAGTQEENVSTMEITAEPTASSEIVDESQPGLVVRPNYSIIVLNGSGVSGEAGYVEDKLQPESLGEIEVGNADRLDYEKTVISLKDSVPDSIRNILETMLSEDYELEFSDEPLPEDAELDIRIIVGARN